MCGELFEECCTFCTVSTIEIEDENSSGKILSVRGTNPGFVPSSKYSTMEIQPKNKKVPKYPPSKLPLMKTQFSDV